MSVYGRRRYDGNFINLNLFNKQKIQEEINTFTIYKVENPSFLGSDYIDHIDFSILVLMIKYQNHMISDKEFFAFLDKIDGYCYAFESGLIGVLNLIEKINKEVLFEEDFIFATRDIDDFD